MDNIPFAELLCGLRLAVSVNVFIASLVVQLVGFFRVPRAADIAPFAVIILSEVTGPGVEEEEDEEEEDELELDGEVEVSISI